VKICSVRTLTTSGNSPCTTAFLRLEPFLDYTVLAAAIFGVEPFFDYSLFEDRPFFELEQCLEEPFLVIGAVFGGRASF
jgi:hypothetical protein